jgi:hypothetical protein
MRDVQAPSRRPTTSPSEAPTRDPTMVSSQPIDRARVVATGVAINPLLDAIPDNSPLPPGSIATAHNRSYACPVALTVDVAHHTAVDGT